ncbi:MAG: hydrogenase expression/formation protein HypE [Pirellulaceae bacterium]|nr:hydrogenase expression/formation protein HypE [Pirellulaceae bacterium]
MTAKQFSCPVPMRDYPNIVLSHGGGGRLSAELIEHVFLPAFGKADGPLADSTALTLPAQRLAVSTDSFVVQPLFFPGGSIGDLAVNGTVNDLAMSGARAMYLTAGFILEEGLPLEQLVEIVADMARAARQASVSIIAGDTKVVERGHGDGCYINTTGIGILAPTCSIGIDRAAPGDVVLISGTIGDHAMAIMSVREGLEFEATIRSDTASLATMVHELLQACPDVRVLRDPTRGGLATTLNEIAMASKCGIEIVESDIPVDNVVRSACEILGLDPLLAANEGKLVAVVPAAQAQRALETLQQNDLGRSAAIIGRAIDDQHSLVVSRTMFGSRRIVPMPIGEQLPRIC